MLNTFQATGLFKLFVLMKCRIVESGKRIFASFWMIALAFFSIFAFYKAGLQSLGLMIEFSHGFQLHFLIFRKYCSFCLSSVFFTTLSNKMVGTYCFTFVTRVLLFLIGKSSA